jgi:DNA primase
MIPDELIERVRESADIVHIIGEHVKLKRSGADFRGPCPFHGGKNPNFSVSPRRAMYHCFKCQESGNVFTFLQKHLGLSFPDAVRYVADTVGIEIPEYKTERAGPDPREPYWEVNATAAEYFREVLWNDPGAAHAREYLEQRGISREIADKFGLGYAPKEIGVFRAHMTTLGFDEERLLQAGLLVKPDETAEPRPRFRNRLMFPILDVSGRHIAFGGRALGDVEPKYLNSPETPVFTKGKTLYALNWTRNDIRKEDRAFVVEGYFDAIRLMISGLNIVVAPLGTALTSAQAALLGRYTKNIYLLYDSDQAGLKATFRAGDELLKQGMSVRVVTLPDGEDPDTLVRNKGAEVLEAYVNQAVDIFERKLQILERGGWFSELQKKRRALDRLLPTVRATSDKLLQELYISRIVEKTGINKDVLMREVRGDELSSSAQSSNEPYASTPAPYPAYNPEIPATRRSPRGNWSRFGRRGGEERPQENLRAPKSVIPAQSAERELVRVMLAEPAQISVVAERISADRFLDLHYRAIFEAIVELSDNFNVEALAESLDPETIGVLNELLEDLEAIVDVRATIEGSIAQIQIREMREQIAEIEHAWTVATEAEKDELLKEKLRLQNEIRLLGQPLMKQFKFLQGQRRR